MKSTKTKWGLVKITLKLAASVLVLIVLVAFARAQQLIVRDSNGRIAGTVTTDANGQRTFRDGSGRMTGTANTDANGMTTTRDASGRITNTYTAPRR